MTVDDRVPVERYFDPDFAELERRHLWPRTWQMACRLEEIPDPGDYVEYTIADQSVLLVRIDERTVRAYLNACRHRATELAKGSGPFPRGQIVCPFHGWRWNLDGTNSFVYGAHAFDPELLAPGRALPPRRSGSTPGAAASGSTSTPPPPRCRRHWTPCPACSTRSGIGDMRVVWWKEVGPPGQLEDGPGGVHGGVPRAPDPPPAHPGPPRAVRPRQSRVLRPRPTVTPASSSARTPRPRRAARSV